MATFSEYISLLVVIFFSFVLGVVLSFFLGSWAIPKLKRHNLEKRAFKKIKEQKEKGYKYYNDGIANEIDLDKQIEKRLENETVN